jgi:ribosomal protein S18 acetylase RimI-like enzyme
MCEILIKPSPFQLVQAIENNFIDFWTYLGRSPRVDLYNGPDMIRFLCDVPFPICNSVFRAKLSLDNLDSEIKDAVMHFQSKGLPVRWMTSPSTQPDNLEDRLQAYGFIDSGYATGMAVNLMKINESLYAPIDLSIQQVDDENMLAKMVQIFTTGYGIPGPVGDLILDILRYLGFELPLRQYIGLLDGKPVACSSLFLSAGVAGIFLVATVEEARGQGIGSALTLKPLQVARDLGYQIGVLGASEMGKKMYRRLGFQDYFKFDIYIKDSETPVYE